MDATLQLVACYPLSTLNSRKEKVSSCGLSHCNKKSARNVLIHASGRVSLRAFLSLVNQRQTVFSPSGVSVRDFLFVFYFRFGAYQWQHSQGCLLFEES